MATLVSVYDLVSDTSNVVRSLKARGFDDLTTYSLLPSMSWKKRKIRRRQRFDSSPSSAAWSAS